MGSSGEGKTTLLHILAGIAPFDEGKIQFLGKNQISPLADQIGMIFQSHNLLEDFTLWENLLLPARILRKNISLLQKRAENLLHTVGLMEKKDMPIKFLSGGEKQRTAIARALICSPEIIIADEPSGNLDHHNSQIIHTLLLDMVRKEKKSLIVATHDRELASLCDEKYLLKEGKLLKQEQAPLETAPL